MVEGTDARWAALEILRRVRAGQLFQTARETAVKDLAGPDRRLAHEIAAGVLRRRSNLDRQLRPLVSGSWRKTSPDLKDLLRIGAFQLAELDRVPAYGAVQATVEVAKREQGRRGAGMVNAILRQVAAKTDPESREPSTSSEAADIADTYSHPAWLVERWLATYGAERTTALLAHNNRRPSLVLQPARWNATRLRDALSANAVQFSDAPFACGYTVRGVRVEDLPGYRDGGFVVQDAAQAHVLEQMRFTDGSVVWDACAAPGGKTAVLSRRCQVMSSDLRRNRLNLLHDTLRRAAPDVHTFLADARHPPVSPGRVETILIDAPCTATGTFARHPDARWRISPERLGQAAHTQAAILEGAASVAIPGTVLIYLTCSLEQEENTQQIDGFLERHPEFRRDCDDVFVFPTDAGTDGAFGARLERIR